MSEQTPLEEDPINEEEDDDEDDEESDQSEEEFLSHISMNTKRKSK